MAILQQFYRYSKVFLTTCSLILLNYKQLGAECRLTLVPSIVTSVCPGDQLMLTCTSTGLQEWSILDPNTEITYTRIIPVPITSRPIITPLQVQSVTFTFAVFSASNTLPLISTLTINAVTPYLNTSVISCLEMNSGKSEMVSIHILGPTPLKSVYVDYHLMDPNFGINNVTVELVLNKTNQENEPGSLVSYNITSPSQVDVQTCEKSVFQLVVPYNTQVNVSIVASLCGQRSIPTVIQLLFTNCGHPPVQHDALRVTGDIQDMMPVMEGFNVSFSCRSEFKLSGHISSTCMRNGEWEPDPREVECRHKVNCGPPSTPQYGYIHPFTSTLEGEKAVFSCSKPDLGSLPNGTNLATVCSGNGTWIPNPSDICAEYSNSGVEKSKRIDAVLVGVITSTVTFALITVLCFIVGFISSRVSTNLTTKCAKLLRGESVNSNTTDYNLSTNPVYNNIMPQEMRPREKDLEVKENVAYIL